MSTLYGKFSSGDNNFNKFENNKFIQGSKDFLKSNSIVAKIVFLILVIFIFIILLRIGVSILGNIFSISQDPILINGMVDGENLLVKYANPNVKGSVPILRSTDQRDGLEFTWSVWVWIKNPPLNNNPAYKANLYKHIFNKGSDTIDFKTGLVEPNNAPGLYISPNYRDLVIVMNTFEKVNEEIIITDIPIEKWVNVIIRCDQHQLDIFINGTLTKSHILKGVPKQNYNNVYIGLNGGFPGRVSLLQYFATAIGTTKIHEIVQSGPNLSSLDKKLTDNIPNYLSFRWFFPEQSSEINF